MLNSVSSSFWNKLINNSVMIFWLILFICFLLKNSPQRKNFKSSVDAWYLFKRTIHNYLQTPFELVMTKKLWGLIILSGVSGFILLLWHKQITAPLIVLLWSLTQSLNCLCSRWVYGSVVPSVLATLFMSLLMRIPNLEPVHLMS